jgi:hypothetical protein
LNGDLLRMCAVRGHSIVLPLACLARKTHIQTSEEKALSPKGRFRNRGKWRWNALSVRVIAHRRGGGDLLRRGMVGLRLNIERPCWSKITVVIVTTLLVATVLAVVATAPISEIIVHLWNSDEQDTAHLLIYLDGSIEEYIYVGPMGWVSWKFHVSPGMHTVGIDFSFDYNYENIPEHDHVIDLELTNDVEFNGMDVYWLRMDENRITSHPGNFERIPGMPLGQAISDPYVAISAVALTALSVLFVITLCKHCRTPPKASVPDEKS